jgi:hypothetical protein
MSDNCIWIDHDSPATCYKAEVRRARKPYRCGECDEEIKVGHMYEYASGKWEGEWSRHRTCARCTNVRTDYFKGGWMFGQIVEDFQSHFGFDFRNGIPKDFAPCSQSERPRELPPPSGTVAMETP